MYNTTFIRLNIEPCVQKVKIIVIAFSETCGQLLLLVYLITNKIIAGITIVLLVSP